MIYLANDNYKILKNYAMCEKNIFLQKTLAFFIWLRYNNQALKKWTLSSAGRAFSLTCEGSAVQVR